MPLITAEIAAFLEGPNSIMVASHDADLVPEIARAAALRCAPDGEHVIVALPSGSAGSLLRQLTVDRTIAVVCERPASHRTLQLKGHVVALQATPDGGRADIERAWASFVDGVEQIGLPRRLTQRFARWPATSVEVRVEQLFEQTPGPGAGEPFPKAAPP